MCTGTANSSFLLEARGLVQLDPWGEEGGRWAWRAARPLLGAELPRVVCICSVQAAPAWHLTSATCQIVHQEKSTWRLAKRG